MKFYTNNSHPSGAAIVKARTKEHAAEVLNNEFRKLGVPPCMPITAQEMKLWPTPSEQVRLLYTNTKKYDKRSN